MPRCRTKRARSGCARPAAARSGRSRCPSRGADDVRRAHRCAPASAAAPRRWSSAAACRRTSTPRCGRRSRRATSRGRSSTATSTSASVEQGPPELRGRTVFCLYPHQTAYVVPAGAVTVVPEDVPPARAVLAGTVETAVNALWDAAPLVGDRVAVVGRRHGRLLRRAPAEPVPGGAGHARGRRCRPGGCRGRARRRLRAAGRRRRRPRPGRAHQRDVGRAAARRSSCWRPRARSSISAGTAMRRSRSRWAARSTPAASASAPARSAPLSPARSGAPHDGRPAGARARPAARPRLRRARDRGVPLRRAARRDGPAGRGEPAGALPHHHLRRGVDRVQRDRARPHDDRPQLPRRGVRAGAAAARRDLRRRRHVPARGPRRRRHRGRHRPRRRGAARRAGRARATATSTTSPPSRA